MLKVVIVGGGIAGLALAKLLEDGGIDFVVLEARQTIAPQEGASIGIGPNGAQVLDRIGCYQSLRNGHAFDKAILRGPNGSVLCQYEGIADFFIKRFHYPIYVFERRRVLQALYDAISDKSRVKSGQKVIKIVQEADRVTVTTNRQNFVASIVVGADGTYSIVRKEILRLRQPPYTPNSVVTQSTTESSCTFACMFGISPPSIEIDPGSHTIVFGRGHSYLIMGGSDGRIYWSLWHQLQSVCHGSQIPRFSKDEEVAVAQKYWGDQISENLTFGMLYERSTSSTLTPVVEHVVPTWHFGRIMIVGDAAHKFDPTSGQGGNAALESAASLADRLLQEQHTAELSGGLISKVLTEVRAKRIGKVNWLLRDSHNQQRLKSMVTPSLEDAALHRIPRLSVERSFKSYVDALNPEVTLPLHQAGRSSEQSKL